MNLALLVLPLVFGAGGSDLNTFLQIHPGTPITVNCDGNYTAYVYTSGDTISAMILVQNGHPVFDPKRYDPVARALLYKMDLSKKYGNVRIMRTDVANALQSLATTLANEEYSYSLAKKTMSKCMPQFVQNVDTLDALRKKAISDILRVAPVLRRDALGVSAYLDRDSYVNCAFSVNTSVYAGVKQIWNDLVNLDTYSKKIIAGVQMADTNCDVQTVKGIIDLLKTPYDLSQLEFLNTASDAEAQIFQNSVAQSDVDSLRRASETMYWKTLYNWLLSAPISTNQGDITISAAFALLENPQIHWQQRALIPEAKKAYNEALSAAGRGDYGNAYIYLQQARNYVQRIINAGTAEEQESNTSNPYIYAGAAIVLAIGAFFLLKRKKGGDDEEMDDFSEYTDDYD
ncbi:MAG: hypothetical protein GXN93_05210 [Candidatus Diapherotrites archaeon]|nr:hypothetical protein [Candidatus Diapherotrites archaeon]